MFASNLATCANVVRTRIVSTSGLEILLITLHVILENNCIHYWFLLVCSCYYNALTLVKGVWRYQVLNIHYGRKHMVTCLGKVKVLNRSSATVLGTLLQELLIVTYARKLLRPSKALLLLFQVLKMLKTRFCWMRFEDLKTFLRPSFEDFEGKGSLNKLWRLKDLGSEDT